VRSLPLSSGPGPAISRYCQSMRKPIKNERAKPVTPALSLDQVVGGNASKPSRDETTELFEEDQNRFRTGL
jgi:hypothetical protein